MRKKFAVKNMRCQGCVGRVRTITFANGADGAEVDLTTGTSLVEVDDTFDTDKYLLALEEAGYPAREVPLEEKDLEAVL
ncbi:heavy-metal-associated domain-containing protein [Guggenheimella bovis]